MNKKWIALVAMIGAMAVVSSLGCAVGDGRNPVPPAKMEELRQQEAQERENFVPPGTDVPKGQ